VTKGQARFIEFHHYARLVEAAENIDPRSHVMVLRGGDAGLRRGETIGLCWEDIDFQRRLLTVRRSVWNGIETVPKGGKPRMVNMTETLTLALKAHRHMRGKRVLYDDQGQETRAKDLRVWMERAVKRACLPLTGGVHILRHTFCSHLAMRGAPAKAIQELAGHEDLSTTLGYMHLSPAARRSAIELLDQVRKDPDAGSNEFGYMLETGTGE
jgi:integrase